MRKNYQTQRKKVKFRPYFISKDRIQFLVRDSVRPSEAKLIDFGEMRNGAEILEELENKENRETHRTLKICV